MLEVAISETGGGKSTFLKNKIALNPNKSFLYLDLESSIEQVSKQIKTLCSLNGCHSVDKFRMSRKKKKAKKAKFGKEYFENNRYLFMRKDGFVKHLDIGTTIKEVFDTIDLYDVDEVIIDSISLVDPVDKKTPFYEHQGNVMHELYKLSQKIDVSTCVQMTRGMHNDGIDSVNAYEVIKRLGGPLDRGEINFVKVYKENDSLMAHHSSTNKLTKVVDLERYLKSYSL